MDSSQKRLTFIGIASLCLILGAFTWIQVRANQRAKDQQYIAQKMSMWSSMGATPSDYARLVLEVQQRLRRGIKPSPRELHQITIGLSGNFHPMIKGRAFGILNTLARRGELQDSAKNEIVDAGLAALKSPSLLLKTRAEILLRYTDDKRAIGPLLPLLNDPEQIARQRAREALQALGYVKR